MVKLLYIYIYIYIRENARLKSFFREPPKIRHIGLKLKCVASISSLYWKSNEKSAESSKHRRTASHMYIAKDGGRYLEDSISGTYVILIYYYETHKACGFCKSCLK